MLILCETGYEMTEGRLDVSMIVAALGGALGWVDSYGFCCTLVKLKMLRIQRHCLIMWHRNGNSCRWARTNLSQESACRPVFLPYIHGVYYR